MPPANHPLVRVRETATRSIALDVGTESVVLVPTEALRLHSDLEHLLVVLGLLAPAQRNAPEANHVF